MFLDTNTHTHKTKHTHAHTNKHNHMKPVGGCAKARLDVLGGRAHRLQSQDHMVPRVVSHI